MDLIVVKTSLAPLRLAPSAGAAVEDEVLFGMAAERLEEKDGFVRVRTRHGCEGWLPAGCLVGDQAKTRPWATCGKMVARAPWLDVLRDRHSESPRLAELPRGGLLHPVGEADAAGWLPVELPGGERGYVKNGNLMPHLTDWKKARDTQKLREALANAALSYLGTQHRHGGKSPLGIDGGGLAFMAYLLNGAAISREPCFKEGFGLHQVEQAALGMGDLIYFPGHVAVYLGEGTYVHATAEAGSDGVVLNSLRPEAPSYQKSLAENVLCCASLF